MENDKDKDNEAFPLRFSLFNKVPPFLRLVNQLIHVTNFKTQLKSAPAR